MRQIRDEDLDDVFKGLSDASVIRYYGVSYLTREAAKEQMEFFKNLELNRTGIWWAICSADNHVFYGAGGLNNLNFTFRKGEIGFWLMPEFWGKGFIREAIIPILEYAFTNLGLHRIEAHVESGNHNSKRVLDKSGFLYEGTMKDCEIKNGKFISLDIYAILNEKN